MKKLVIFFLLVLIITGCKKEKEGTQNEGANKTEVEKPKIDFEEIKNKIDVSQSLDIEVFFAISVYHKYYISTFQKEAETKTEEEQKKFYLQRKDDFFNSIKYSEKEYNEFMEKNAASMSEFISAHPDIADYLISTN